MAFVIKKKISGKEYYYLNETRRVNGKVVSKCISYLGKDKKEAEKKAKKILKERIGVSKMESVNEKNTNLVHKSISVEELNSFCKRKGFVYPSGEIYGGFAGFWDFGPLGVEFKNNLKGSWWKYFVGREDIVGIDGSIITHPKIWKASGHVDSFSDVFVVCKKCKKPGKVDRAELGKKRCENCGGEYDNENAKDFKLMFEMSVGADSKSYLRPETAQLIFADFKSVQDNARMKLPFGIAQIGKAFRNEIAPRDFLFRSREFEQMEMQFFIDSDKLDDCGSYDKISKVKINIKNAEGKEEVLSIEEMFSKNIFKNKWHAYWLVYSYNWFIGLGIKKENLRLREHEKAELAHYANAAVDIEFNFPSGWREIFGSHDRGTFDLGEHEKFSSKDMKIYDEETKRKVLPYVIESSFGVERAFMAFMFDSYSEREGNVILSLNPRLSPVKAAIFPIVKGDEYEEISKGIFEDLRVEWNIIYDKSGSIGRRYARNDEIGTPMCITIDEQTLKDNSVTIRDRDTTEQVRVKIKELHETVRKVVNGDNLLSFGKLVKTRVK